MKMGNGESIRRAILMIIGLMIMGCTIGVQAQDPAASGKYSIPRGCGLMVKMKDPFARITVPKELSRTSEPSLSESFFTSFTNGNLFPVISQNEELEAAQAVDFTREPWSPYVLVCGLHNVDNRKQ